jgi:hypothetical protein
MRLRKREKTALLYASGFAGATACALYFLTDAPMYAALVSAAMLFAVCFAAVHEYER